jgi:hypothetical protein
MQVGGAETIVWVGLVPPSGVVCRLQSGQPLPLPGREPLSGRAGVADGATLDQCIEIMFKVTFSGELDRGGVHTFINIAEKIEI